MMQDRQAITLAARVVIRLQGEAAVDHARRMARRYTKAGEQTAAGEWLEIGNAIRDLVAAKDQSRSLPSE